MDRYRNNIMIMAFYKRRKWIENYSSGNTNRPSYIDDIKALKAELAKLLEDARPWHKGYYRNQIG
jgi:hypothetical protein